MKYLTKAALYRAVNKLMRELDIKSTDYPLDSVFLAQKFFVDAQIVYKDFDRLCAVLYRGRNTTSLALNLKRTPAMQNFDCMHEIIHYFLHEDISTFHCFAKDGPLPIDDTLEWQANEGAAEALLPYRLFIPAYINFSTKDEENAMKKLADTFRVTEKVVENRIDNLQYEIYQYKVLNKKISEIEILSKTSCERKKLSTLSPSDTYCEKCHNPIFDDWNFCAVCGKKLSGGTNVKKGVGSVCYNRIELNENLRATSCPRCNNSKLSEIGYYCHLCGAPIANRCTNDRKSDTRGAKTEWPCQDDLLPGDARFCPTCGSSTTFLSEGILKKIF